MNLTFGVNSSQFQAQFVLQQHAKKYKDRFPMAAETIEKSTYMDDSMDSLHTEEQDMELYLDTDSFLNAFYRMASRRGLPEEMFSDKERISKGRVGNLKCYYQS